MGLIRGLAAVIVAVGLVQDVLTGTYTLPEWLQPSGGSLSHSRAASNLTVDIGYAVYQGVRNSSSKLNVWKGCVLPCPDPPN